MIECVVGMELWKGVKKSVPTAPERGGAETAEMPPVAAGKNSKPLTRFLHVARQIEVAFRDPWFAWFQG